jgi:hypothetical protein
LVGLAIISLIMIKFSIITLIVVGLNIILSITQKFVPYYLSSFPNDEQYK